MTALPAVPESRPALDITTSPAVRLRGTPPAATPDALLDILRAAGSATDVIDATATWLARRGSEHSRTAYAKDASWWLAWCAATDTNPARPKARDADKYAAALRAEGLAKTTRARRLAAASAWYEYLVRDEIADRNPFAGMQRPTVDQDASSTHGLTANDLARLLAYARDHESTRTYALLAMLATTAARITSALTARAGALGYDEGHRCIDLVVKGDKKKRFVLEPLALDALTRHMAGRTLGPDELLFATRTGNAMDEPAAFRLIRRVAQAAGMREQAAKLSPHSIRHSFATAMLGAGVPLHFVQDAMGHADPRTTRRYDRAKGSLDNSPAYKMGKTLRKGMSAGD